MDFNGYGLFGFIAELIIFIFVIIAGGILVASLFLRLIYRKQEGSEKDNLDAMDS